jgi:hypothetical protein
MAAVHRHLLRGQECAGGGDILGAASPLHGRARGDPLDYQDELKTIFVDEDRVAAALSGRRYVGIEL